MYYKIIVYKQHYKTITTKKSCKTVVYFQKIKTVHNIHKAILSKEYLKMWSQFKDWDYTINTLLETERDDLIEKNNTKTRQYFNKIQVC